MDIRQCTIKLCKCSCNVLFARLIVLFVNVWVSVKVAIESIATVKVLLDPDVSIPSATNC